MGRMEDRFRQRQGNARGSSEPPAWPSWQTPVAATSGDTEAQRAEMFREFHAQHIIRQTKAVETIKNIAVAWVTLTIIGVVLFMIAASQSGSRY